MGSGELGKWDVALWKVLKYTREREIMGADIIIASMD